MIRTKQIFIFLWNCVTNLFVCVIYCVLNWPCATYRIPLKCYHTFKPGYLGYSKSTELRTLQQPSKTLNIYRKIIPPNKNKIPSNYLRNSNNLHAKRICHDTCTIKRTIPKIGKSHLASVRIVGNRAYNKRMPTSYYDDDKVRNDVNLLSYYLKNRKAAAENKEPAVVLESCRYFFFIANKNIHFSLVF